MAFSMASSTASSSFSPPAAKILMPLSGIALCEAEITTPRSAPRSSVRNATAGVGSTPSSRTSAPAEARPAATAASSISPLARGSRPTTASGCPDGSGPATATLDPPGTSTLAGGPSAATGRRSTSTFAGAVARLNARCGVRSALARPRTPSVPNSLAPTAAPFTSALGVLGRLARLLQSVLLALGGPRIAGQEPILLQHGPVGIVKFDQGAGDREPQRAGLTGHAATLEAGVHVVDLRLFQHDQGFLDQLLVHLVREVAVQRPPVQGEDTGARHHPHPDDGLLAPADGLHRTVDRHREHRGGNDLGQFVDDHDLFVTVAVNNVDNVDGLVDDQY